MSLNLNENKSLTDVVNSALVLIGDTPIKNLFDENDGRAMTARHIVKQAILEVQVHHTACWDELIKDKLLTLRHKFRGGEYAYNIPLNMLSVHGVFDDKGAPIEWREIEGTLRTEVPAKHIRFVEFSTNPDEWSPELKSCVISLLAAKLIAGIVKDFTTSAQMVQTFWMVEFPRWINNRRRNGERSHRGDNAQLRKFYPNPASEGLQDSKYY